MAEKTKAASEDLVMARKTRSLKSAVTYSTKSRERKMAQPGDDISDMCDEDLAYFEKTGLIATQLVAAEE